MLTSPVSRDTRADTIETHGLPPVGNLATVTTPSHHHLAILLVVLALLATSGCQAGDDVPTLDQTLRVGLPPGSTIPGVARAYDGFARNPSSLERDGIFRVETADELRRLWEAQCTGPPPTIDWQHQTVVAAFFTRAEATSLRMARFQRAPDGAQQLWLVGDTQPLQSVRYNYPWCIAVLPVRGGRIHVNLMYATRQPTGEWRLKDRGTRLIIQQ
ncbi:MAG: hypothetical protein AB7S36_11710 [Planctomycetota bacterium]